MDMVVGAPHSIRNDGSYPARDKTWAKSIKRFWEKKVVSHVLAARPGDGPAATKARFVGLFLRQRRRR